MLTVEVKINGRLVAKAVAINESELADYSDYAVQASEEAYPAAGIAEMETRWRIEAHERNQSSWALVEKIAAAMRFFHAEPEEARIEESVEDRRPPVAVAV